MNPTPHTDAWKARLRAALGTHGARAELARFLAGSNPDQLKWRTVQLSKVLNTDRQPESEFLLTVEEWLSRQKSASHFRRAARLP